VPSRQPGPCRADNQGEQNEFLQNELQKRHLDLERMLARMGRRVDYQEAFVDQRAYTRHVQGHLAQGRGEGSCAGSRDPVERNGVRRADQDHPLDLRRTRRDGRKGRRGDGPGIDVAGVRDDKRHRPQVARPSRRLEEPPQQDTQIRWVPGIEETGDGGLTCELLLIGERHHPAPRAVEPLSYEPIEAAAGRPISNV
jgi:hypothetical protein